MFLDDLRQYLMVKGFTNIYTDFMPDTPHDAIGLFLYAHPASKINAGGGARYVQIQVRDKDITKAQSRAYEIIPHLDSGLDEDIIYLTDRWSICRVKKYPTKLKETESGTTYYLEVVVYARNTP